MRNKQEIMTVKGRKTLSWLLCFPLSALIEPKEPSKNMARRLIVKTLSIH